MKVELYDNIKLKTGQNASVVEILGNHKAYIVDVDLGDDYETITVSNEQIAEVISCGRFCYA